jgi:cell division septation protein DedD
MSLDPRTSEPPPTRPVAAAPPVRVATAPATAPSGAGGGFVVQISSQKSDAEAQASIKALQAKYPHLLNGNPPHVSRADLGAKGVYYRAVVGPFASSGEANSFCTGLKAAGGQCIIQRN